MDRTDRNIWQTIRDFLSKLYQAYLEDDFDDFIECSPDKDPDSPAWVELEEGITFGNIRFEGQGALLFDPVIGLLNFFFPFDGKESSKVRTQVQKALRLRSRLLAGPIDTLNKFNKSDNPSEIGICLYWIAEYEEAYSSWLETIMRLRNRTTHLEELTVDVIAVRENENLITALERHGLPRLLLNVRRVLKFKSAEEVYRWRSADAKVLQMLETFPDTFENLEQNLAYEVVKYAKRQAGEIEKDSEPSAKGKKKYLGTLKIENFRNITRAIAINFGARDLAHKDRTVAAHIVHGPNATGKTTIYEALQFALESVSERQHSFLIDKDISIAKPDRYFDEYLKCFDNRESEPKIGMQELLCKDWVLDPRENEGYQRLQLLMDAMMSQDRIKGFVEMKESELNAAVLRGYSEVADKIERYVQDRYQKVHSERQSLLRELALRANITKLSTAKLKIIELIWQKKMPFIDETLISTLRNLWTSHEISGVEGVDKLIRMVEAARDAAIPPSKEEGGMDRQKWVNYLNVYNNTVEQLNLWANGVREITKDWDEELINDLHQWAHWLKKKRGEASAQRSIEDKGEIEKKLDLLIKERKGILAEKQFLENHLKHLDHMSDFIEQSWSKEYPDICPVCNSKLGDRGGILNVFSQMKTAVRDTTVGKEKVHQARDAKIKELQKELVEEATCPIPTEVQTKLRAMVEILAPEAEDLETLLTNDETLKLLLVRASTLKGLFYVPEQEHDVKNLVDEALQTIKERFDKAKEVWHAPDLWNSVKNELIKKMAEIVEEHLPKTIERLWCEIAFGLTPTPWLIPDRDLRIISKDNGKRIEVGIRIKGRVGRYVLNRVEANIIGLAWFITRYLLEGRFNYGCMIIDDPAQDMDEVTFRTFCRFFYGLLLLHQSYGEELSLVFLQHEDERASTAANILHGYLHRLEIDNEGAPKLGKTLDVTQGIWHIPSLKEAWM